MGKEGRATGYPRVLCKLRTEDGRTGVGICEYFYGVFLVACRLKLNCYSPKSRAAVEASVFGGIWAAKVEALTLWL